MTNPKSIARAERLFWGRIGTDYDILGLICPMAAELSRRVGAVVAGLPSPVSGTLAAIEIGCGTGITTQALLHARDDLELTAVDNEPAMLERARDNLSAVLGTSRLALVEADALSALQAMPSASADLVASVYTIHNFLDDYRTLVLAEIFRVLRPGGIFVNGDRYALDDAVEQTRLTQAEAQRYMEVLLAMGRTDLLQHWILHLFSDASPERVMGLAPARGRMQEIGFGHIEVLFREGFDTVLFAAKPLP
jgi:ubiquinone/menaquinone biosynthesis C-methylase UbiE